MKSILSFLLVSSAAFFANAALPPQFSDCLTENSASNLSVTDVKEIAKVSRITYCQNQVGFVGKVEAIDLLSSPNVQMGISVSKTSYSVPDLLEMGRAGTYVLYVDSARLNRDNLISLSQVGVQLVIMTSQSGLSKTDLLAIAAAKPFILNVNSSVNSADLREYVAAGVQVVIRTAQSGLSRADIVAVASANSAMVTVMP